MLTSLFFTPQYIHSADIIHRVSFSPYLLLVIKLARVWKVSEVTLQQTGNLIFFPIPGVK